MKYALLVFLATWISVFTLGLQSRNVNQGHYWASAFTSIGIGAGHVMLYKYMPSADWLELAGYFAGGITGITSSIWFHKRAAAWLPQLRARIAAAIARWKATASRRLDEDEHRDVGMTGAIAIRCPRCGCGPNVPVCKYDLACPRLQTDVH